MPKYKAKTIETANGVSDFIDTIGDEQRKKDALAIIKIMREQSGFEAKMWGAAIIGFGSYHYKYESGHEGDAPLVAFSPRKNEFSLYLTSAFDGREDLLKQFGKYKTGKACIYVKKLEDINIGILKKMITGSVKFLKEKYT
ncbi:DUF1801 domain-containing protein [Agriterribacter sp.]|uniref:DUF1801 domain-containing protein n=1 Tax=Agriterribacter sp. TaxID=2821509 RepID=UPI002B7D3AA8|nr:DUF1801 domain-containing protein [Agriterribacter sp.]HRP55625.1 DUF1801 domain-containing protein [Agriterribacter sp.]